MSDGGIENYTELVQAIEDQMARNDIIDRIPRWIQLTELDIIRDCRIADSDQVITGTLSTTDPFINLPAGIIAPRHIEIQSTPLRTVTIVSLKKRSDVLENDVGNLPRVMTQVGNQLYFAPAPKTAEAYQLFYYGKPPPLSPSNPTNLLLDIGADLLFYGALKEGASWAGDLERKLEFMGEYVAKKESVKRAYFRQRTGGGVLRVRPDFAPGDVHDQGSVG